MKLKWYASPYIVWMVLFTVAPLVLLLYFSTRSDQGFTLEHFKRFFDPLYIGILVRSLWMAVLCTVISLVLGYPTAYLLSKRREGSVLALLFILPMWMNFLLRTYAWMSILENTGVANKALQALGFPQMTLLYTPGAVLLGMVYNFLPFMILPIMTVLRKMDRSLIEAAGDLGANPLEVFRRVILPLSLPGVISGITMVFMPAVTTFVISRLLGGSQYMLFGDLIEQQFLQTADWSFGSALSVIMMALMLLSMAVMNRLGGTEQQRGQLI